MFGWDDVIVTVIFKHRTPSPWQHQNDFRTKEGCFCCCCFLLLSDLPLLLIFLQPFTLYVLFISLNLCMFVARCVNADGWLLAVCTVIAFFSEIGHLNIILFILFRAVYMHYNSSMSISLCHML